MTDPTMPLTAAAKHLRDYADAADEIEALTPQEPQP